LGKRAPGLYESMDVLCRARTDRSCIELLLDKPSELRKILVSKYGDQYSTEFIVRYMLLRPVLASVGAENMEEEMTKLFMHNARGFSKKLRELLGAKHLC